MHADHSNESSKSVKKIIKWLLIITGVVCLVCIGLTTLIYAFFVPTLYESRVGAKLPETAQVLHQNTRRAGLDVSYQLAIQFKDDQARDQIIKSWQLKPGGDHTASSIHYDIDWWPNDRIQKIRDHGEFYGRIDYQAERWWNLYVDRDQNILYVEQGRW